jgi:hypothetical protein
MRWLHRNSIEALVQLFRQEKGRNHGQVFLSARECAPGPQGRPNRPSSTILLVVGRRRRPIDGLSISQTDSDVAKRGGTIRR